MRSIALALLAGVVLGASAAAAGSLALVTSTRGEITDCPQLGGDGGTATRANLPGGDYLMRVSDEAATVCFGAYDAGTNTCVSGGEKFPAGFTEKIRALTDGFSFSCRSDGGTADVIFTKAVLY